MKSLPLTPLFQRLVPRRLFSFIPSGKLIPNSKEIFVYFEPFFPPPPVGYARGILIAHSRRQVVHGILRQGRNE